jgi:glycosyltransferase involved in cell wall biosynthesis
MSSNGPLRIALILDPLSLVLSEERRGLRGKWGEHAPALATELLGHGHLVRGFGVPPGFLPQSGAEAATSARNGEPKPAPWRRGLREFRADVIVAYDALSAAAFRGARTARRLGAALVLVDDARARGERMLEDLLSRAGAALWGRFVRRTASGLVTLDELGRTRALDEGFDPALVHLVPHGIDLVRFRPGLSSPLVARYRIDGRILLYVGRLAADRGLETLIAAFARTVGQRGDWTLVLAGDGPERPGLQAQAGRLGVADRVRWLPRPRAEEIPGLMGASTLLAFPASSGEIVGRQIGRALACGLPVLASDLPRMRGLIEPGHSGLLAEAGDEQAWTDALQRAASAPEARKRWGRNARELAERELAWSVVGARFEEALFAARERWEAKRGTLRKAMSA